MHRPAIELGASINNWTIEALYPPLTALSIHLKVTLCGIWQVRQIDPWLRHSFFCFSSFLRFLIFFSFFFYYGNLYYIFLYFYNKKLDSFEFVRHGRTGLFQKLRINFLCNRSVTCLFTSKKRKQLLWKKRNSIIIHSEKKKKTHRKRKLVGKI